MALLLITYTQDFFVSKLVSERSIIVLVLIWPESFFLRYGISQSKIYEHYRRDYVM
jgi:hypothetical protein